MVNNIRDDLNTALRKSVGNPSAGANVIAIFSAEPAIMNETEVIVTIVGVFRVHHPLRKKGSAGEVHNYIAHAMAANVRASYPNHLNFGCAAETFAYLSKRESSRLCIGGSDAISINIITCSTMIF